MIASGRVGGPNPPIGDLDYDLGEDQRSCAEGADLGKKMVLAGRGW